MTMLILAFLIMVSDPDKDPDKDLPARFVVIVHSSNPTLSLSENEVSDFLLKKSRRWDLDDNRLHVMAINLGRKNSVRKAFAQAIHGRKPEHIERYWARLIFSGEDTPPPTASSEDQVLQYVRDNPGSIGYVSAVTSLDGVKEITVYASDRKWRKR